MISVFEALYSKDSDKIKKIRYIVFVEGQNVPEDIEIDGKDPECYHVLLTKDDIPVGTGRMEKDGHIGRIAVLENFRGMNFGSMIMNKLEEIAASNDLKTVYLNSQKHAIPFYIKLGYKTVGDYFIEAGIEHKKMIKKL